MLLTALKDVVTKLEAELMKAEQDRDPLVTHIYHARRAYWRACEIDTSKSGHRVRTQLEMSYKEADKLGFRAGKAAWHAIMMSHVSKTGT